MAEDVTIWMEDPSNDAVEGVYVGLHDSATKAKLQSGTTNASGNVIFPAVDEASNSGLYEVRVKPPAPGSVTSGSVQTITVVAAGNNNFDFEVSFTGLDTAVAAYLCRCTGYFEDFTGLAAQGAVLEISEHCIPQLALLPSGDIDSRGILPFHRVFTTDTSGRVVVDLVRDTFYQVLLQGFWNNPRTVKIPDASSANLTDIIFPFTKSVEWYDSNDAKLTPTASPTWAMTIGDEDDMTVKVISRAGVVLHPSEVTFASSDIAVLTMGAPDTDGLLTLTAVTAGTATVTLTRVTTTDLGISGTSDPAIVGVLTVTVT